MCSRNVVENKISAFAFDDIRLAQFSFLVWRKNALVPFGVLPLHRFCLFNGFEELFRSVLS